MRSILIWQNRYEEGGNSGSGSRNELANYKINFLNSFFKENSINSVLDFGCGDCYISSKLVIENYTGIDICDVYFDKYDFNAINKSLIKKRFDEIDFKSNFDCVICLDVLYHILEDELEYLHNTLDNIFKYADKYIIIYAQDFNDDESKKYNTHMFNSNWQEYLEKKDVSLIYKQDEFLKNTSAKFFVYEKKLFL